MRYVPIISLLCNNCYIRAKGELIHPEFYKTMKFPDIREVGIAG